MSAPTAPTQDLSWATNANYDAPTEPYDGTPTQTEPDSGRKANGWEPGMKPTAQETGWWMAGVKAWFDYVVAYIAYVIAYLSAAPPVEWRNEFPRMITASNWAETNSGTYSNLCVQASAAGSFSHDLHIPDGWTLGEVVVSAKGGAAGQTLAIGVTKYTLPNDVNESAGSETFNLTNGTAAQYTINFGAQSATLALGATTTGGTPFVGQVIYSVTYTRTAGDFTADGFFVGAVVSVSGYTNGQLNMPPTGLVGATIASGPAITAVSALSMTVEITLNYGSAVTAATETETTMVNGRLLTGSSSFQILLNIGAGGSGTISQAVANIRYQLFPPTPTLP